MSSPGWTPSLGSACTLDSHSVVLVPTSGVSSPQSLSGSLLLHSDIALEMPSTGEGGHVAKDGGGRYMYMYVGMFTCTCMCHVCICTMYIYNIVTVCVCVCVCVYVCV